MQGRQRPRWSPQAGAAPVAWPRALSDCLGALQGHPRAGRQRQDIDCVRPAARSRWPRSWAVQPKGQTRVAPRPARLILRRDELRTRSGTREGATTCSVLRPTSPRRMYLLPRRTGIRWTRRPTQSCASTAPLQPQSQLRSSPSFPCLRHADPAGMDGAYCCWLPQGQCREHCREEGDGGGQCGVLSTEARVAKAPGAGRRSSVCSGFGGRNPAAGAFLALGLLPPPIRCPPENVRAPSRYSGIVLNHPGLLLRPVLPSSALDVAAGEARAGQGKEHRGQAWCSCARARNQAGPAVSPPPASPVPAPFHHHQQRCLAATKRKAPQHEVL